MRLSNYNPEQPPELTPEKESERLFGQFCWRAKIFVFFWWLFTSGSLEPIWQLPTLQMLFVGALMLRALWKLAQGLEVAAYNVYEAFGTLKGLMS